MTSTSGAGPAAVTAKTCVRRSLTRQDLPVSYRLAMKVARNCASEVDSMLSAAPSPHLADMIAARTPGRSKASRPSPGARRLACGSRSRWCCAGAGEVERDVDDHVFLSADHAATADFDEDVACVHAEPG